MYESPVTIISKHIRFEQEEGIFRAIQEYGININKGELIKAINYDRNQYQKGYDDGFADAKDQAQLELERVKENLEEAHIDIREHMAEIERLTVNKNACALGMKRLAEQLEQAKSEAIKEVLSALETTIEESDKYIREYEDSKEQRAYNKALRDMYNLVAEMTESPTKIEHSSLCETDTYEALGGVQG